MELQKIAEQAVEAAVGGEREAEQAAPETTLEGMLESAASRMAREPEKKEAVQDEQAAPEGEAAKETQAETEQKDEPGKLQAPAHWSDDDKKAFADLDPKAQQLFLDRHRKMEGNLNRKHEELAEERNRLKAWEALVTRIQGDPQFANHVFAYGKQPQDQQHVYVPQPPEDPIERLKWEAVQVAKEEMRRELQPILGQQQQRAAHLEMQAVIGRAQADPLFSEVDQEVTRAILEAPIPDLAKKSFAERLQSDPLFYRETYEKGREAVLRRKGSEFVKNKDNPDKTKVDRVEKPRPTAPVLEGAGASGSELHGAAARAKIQSLTKKIKSNSAEPSDIGAYLEAVGAFGRMGI